MAAPAAKTCTKCGLEKLLDAFQPNPNGRYGRKSTCRECNLKATREWRQTNRDKVRAQKRRFWTRHKDRLNEVRRDPAQREHQNALRREAYRQDPRRVLSQVDPVKRYARFRVWQAVNSGQLVRGDCVFCGASNAQAHHEDYSKPLEVTWMCPRCHSAYHREAVV
jgi:ribosomal protein S27AE